MYTVLAVLLGFLLFVALLWYPWLSVAVLLAVPIVKAGAKYYVPVFQQVDLTFLACALAGAAALWNLIRRLGHGAPFAVPWKQLACLLVLGLALFVGLAWTSAPTYGLRKAYRFIGICVPYLLLPTFFVRSRKDGHAMIRMIILVGTLAAVAVIALPRSYLAQITYGSGYARGTVLGSNPIIPAVMISMGLISLLCSFVVRGSASRWLRYSGLFVLPVGVVAILKTGTRSGLLGLLVTAMVLPFLSGRRTRTKGMFVLVVAIPLALGFGFVFTQSTSSKVLERWSSLGQADPTQSLVEVRLDYYKFCLLNWWKRPMFGHGSGSFAVDKYGWDEPAYPHNIVLEAMYETGLVGTMGLLTFLLVTTRIGLRGLRQATTPQDRLLVLVPCVLVLMLLIQGMMHWDLDGVRLLYLFAGLLHANVTQVTHARQVNAQGS